MNEYGKEDDLVREGSAAFTSGVMGVLIILARDASEVERKAAEILQMRISKRGPAKALILTEPSPESQHADECHDLVIFMGCAQSQSTFVHRARRDGVEPPKLPDSDTIHPESFAIKTESGPKPQVLIISSNGRGAIFAVGALLRAVAFTPRGISVPHMDLRDKPSLWLRGTEASAGGPRSGAKETAKLRPQTRDELRETIEDLMLLGGNVFQGEEELVRACGMMTYGGCVANALQAPFPQEWAATPSDSLHVKVSAYFRKSFVCPSIPEARKALLDRYETIFAHSPPYDFFVTNSGDVGGCTCSGCMPWGRTYIKLVHEMAGILHKHRPECRLMATNQNLTNEGNQAILDYLNEKQDSRWLFAIRYGPGGNEMDTYNRGPVNPKWFEYEGFGPVGHYLEYIHHQLPGTTEIALFSDVTHWILSQYGVQRPDPAFAAIYGRRSWNARPRHYHRIATETFHYALGDMFYSEGMHDDFNKWLWLRLLWNPRLSCEEVTGEYCRYWFGRDAEDEMVQAIFTMEENLEKPVLGNPGIARAVEILRSAKSRIPPNLLKVDYRWNIAMQKALLDRYIQLWLERGDKIKRDASAVLARVATSARPRREIMHALRILRQPQEDLGMRAIREKVRALGERSNETIGYREPGYFVANEYDITEIGWWIKTLQEATTETDEAMRNAARMVLAYEDPGQGGRYERLGWPWGSGHLLEENDIIGFFPFTGPARLASFGMAYSWGRPDAHLTFVYGGLDPEVQYCLRLSVGFHCDELKQILGQGLLQTLEVNGVVIGREVPLPLGGARLCEFTLPAGLARDGRLTVVLRSESSHFHMVGASEIWLMHKDRMPWTTNWSRQVALTRRSSKHAQRREDP